MCVEKLQLLESVLGKGSKSNRDYYQFICPFHEGRNGPKLGVSLGSGGWKCWVCPSKGGSIQQLFKKLNQDPSKIQLARELWAEKQVYQKKETNESFKLPKEFKPLWIESGSFFYQKAKGYLYSRGVTEMDILKHRLGYCETGRYSDMVIFPSYDENNQLNFFSGRSYLSNPTFKFAIPTEIEKNQIFDESLVNWSEPLILVESKLDAIVVRRNAIPLYGKQINHKLRERIINSEVPKIIFCLDGDALQDALNQASYFIENGIECWKVKFPFDEDPSSLGYEKVWQFINQAEKITESNNFENKILNLLK